MTLSNCSWNEDKSDIFEFDINFPIESSARKIVLMYHWIAYCVLYKSYIDIEPLSLTLNGVNTHFIHQPPQKSDNFDFDINFFKEQSIAKKFEMCS